RRRHTSSKRDWSSDVCSSDLGTYYIKIAALNGESSREAYVLRLSRIAVAGMDLSEQNMLTRSLHPDSPTAYDLGMGLNSGGNYKIGSASCRERAMSVSTAK